MSTPTQLAPAPWSLRIAAALATLAAIALLALVASHWLWRALAPAPVEVLSADPRDPAATILSSGLLAAAGTPNVAPATPAAPPLAGDTRLLGVFAEAGGRGYALFRFSDRGPRLVPAGAEIAPGTTLVAVRPDGITVRDAVGERTIALRAPPVAPAPKAEAVAPVRVAAACAIPQGFRGAVVKLNAELVQGMIGQPEALRAIVAPADGGLTVRDESGFAAMLGLKRGDRVLTANGIALATPDDVAAAVLKPLVASQPVRVTGSRDAQPREMLLLNAGACPA
jgi:hypothetical protein